LFLPIQPSIDFLGFKRDHSLRLFSGTGGRYRIGDLGFIYHIGRGKKPILVAGLSALIIGQVLNAAQVTGVRVICLVLFILALSGGKSGGSGQFLFALLIGATITGYSFIDGVCVRVATTPLSYILLLIFVLPILFSLFLLWRRHGCIPAIARVHGKQFEAAGSRSAPLTTLRCGCLAMSRWPS
tara:strand:- start:1474 stop:2025 length:552 start_codon:yes stop_codon:yes gene_type:complete